MTSMLLLHKPLERSQVIKSHKISTVTNHEMQSHIFTLTCKCAHKTAHVEVFITFTVTPLPVLQLSQMSTYNLPIISECEKYLLFSEHKSSSDQQLLATNTEDYTVGSLRSIYIPEQC